MQSNIKSYKTTLHCQVCNKPIIIETISSLKGIKLNCIKCYDEKKAKNTRTG